MQDNTVSRQNDIDQLPFLQGGGEMGTLIRAHYWQDTVLGEPGKWPQSLKTTLSILINSKFPMFLFWGTELLCFYNDAYRPSLGNNGKHSYALGKPGKEVWPEIWDFIGPMIAGILTGEEASWYEDQLLPIYRNGKMEDVYWTFSYSPVNDESGKPAGVFVTCFETTAKVTNLKNLEESKDELAFAIDATELGTWDLDPLTNKFKGNARLKEWFGLKPEEHILLDMAIHVMDEKDRERVTAAINRALQYESGGHYDIEYAIIHPQTHKKRLVRAKGRAWFNEENVAYRFNGTLQDISQQKKSVQQQEEANKLLQSVLDASMVGISVLKAVRNDNGEIIDFSYLLVNSVTENTNNSIPLIGRLYSTVHSGYHEAGIFDGFKEVIETGISQQRERHYTGEGFDNWYNTVTVKLGDGVVFSFQDITEDVLSRNELLESENRFRSIVEQAPVATCLFVGPEMIIEIANDIMISYWGKGRTVMGQPLIQALPELIDQPFPEILSNIYQTGITHTDRDAPVELVIDKVPGIYYFDFTYKPLLDSNGKVYAIMNMAVDVTERFTANKKIAEAQQQILQSFQQSPVGIAILDLKDLTFTMVNDFYAQLVGRAASEILNKPLLEALPELQGQGFDVLLRQVIQTGIPYIANEVAADLFRNEKMERIYVDLSYLPRRDMNNNLSGVLVVATDVTQQVISRRKVEASERRFRSLIEEAPIPTCLFVGPDMIVELANEAMLKTWGKGNDVLGKPHNYALPELEAQVYPKILEEVYASGKAYEGRSSKADLVINGVIETHYFNFTYKPLFNNDEKVYAIMAMAVDVTDEVMGRQKIEKAEAALRGAIELAELSTWSLDIKKNTISYSDRFMEWLGFNEDTKALDDAYNPLPGKYRQSVPEQIAAAIEPGSTGTYDNEHPIVNRVTGQVRIIHAHAQVFYDEKGDAAFLTGTAQDITEQRNLQLELERQVEERTAQLAAKATELFEANKALQQTNTELNEFAYIASHDLQEPLRKVRTFTDMMESSLENVPEKTKSYIDRIQSSTERMQVLINDVLKFSLLSQERKNFEEVDLNETIQHILSDYELLIEQKEATVTAGRLPVLEAVPLQMVQLFTNLISNALKFSSPDRALQITVNAKKLSEEEVVSYEELSADKVYYQIEFKDNGIGFNQKNAVQIFTIFQRLHSKSEYEGTGIGLALCKKIVVNHHGIIYANSQKDEGAAFVIILPEKQGGE